MGRLALLGSTGWMEIATAAIRKFNRMDVTRVHRDNRRSPPSTRRIRPCATIWKPLAAQALGQRPTGHAGRDAVERPEL